MTFLNRVLSVFRFGSFSAEVPAVQADGLLTFKAVADGETYLRAVASGETTFRMIHDGTAEES